MAKTLETHESESVLLVLCAALGQLWKRNENSKSGEVGPGEDIVALHLADLNLTL